MTKMPKRIPLAQIDPNSKAVTNYLERIKGKNDLKNKTTFNSAV